MARSPRHHSYPAKLARVTTPAALPRIVTIVQPAGPSPKMSANVRAPRPSVASAAPVMSSGSRSIPTRIEIQREFKTSAAAATGRLIMKIERHPTSSISHPPRIGPIPEVAAAAAAQIPIARSRPGPSNVSLRIARLFGVSSATATPCSARPAMSHPSNGASAHATEAAAKRTMPAANTRPRPNLSPSAPPNSTRALRGRR